MKHDNKKETANSKGSTTTPKYFCIYFVAAGTCFEQTFFVKALSEADARAELLRNARGAEVRQVVEVQYSRFAVYADAMGGAR